MKKFKEKMKNLDGAELLVIFAIISIALICIFDSPYRGRSENNCCPCCEYSINSERGF